MLESICSYGARAVLLALAGTLAACGAREPVAPPPDRAATPSTPAATKPGVPEGPDLTVKCEETAPSQSGQYMAENNSWGKGDLQGWSQCIAVLHDGGKPAQARWIWDWLESGDNVKAYPEIVFGHKPGYPKSTTDLLPRRISSIGQAQLSYDLDTVRYGAGNLSVDMWLTSSDKPAQFAAPPITHEIMIWLEHFGPMYAGGKLQEHAVIDGVPYRVYLGDNFGQGWRYVAFLPSIPLRKQARMNLVAYFDYLKSKGWVSGDEYLSAVNIGNEIISGKGETRVRALSIDIGASPSPTPATSSPSGTQTTSAIATRP